MDYRKCKGEEYMVVLKEIQWFGLQFTAFCSTCHALKTWFELSRVNYIEKISDGKQKLLRVTKGKITVNV